VKRCALRHEHDTLILADDKERMRYSAEHGPFALPGDQPHYAPDRPADVRHIVLDLTVDFDQRTIRGTATTHFTALFDNLRAVTLRAAELIIERVTLDGPDGPPLSYTCSGSWLRVELDQPRSHGDAFAITITYHARPRAGLTFTGPTPDDPQRPRQVWSQGQPESNHYWFPCHDSPNDRATTEMIVTVPAPFLALSNGKLLSVTEHPERGTKTYHWRHNIPHPAYLVTLVAGEFAELHDEYDGIPLLTYVRPDRREDAPLLTGKTREMVRFFSERFGIPYPYEKYAQIIAEEFTGAMENTSATTHSFTLLPDRRAALDYDVAPLVVAHELVHQWFGDLLTCRDWAHIWLNESFATYFEAVWRQYDEGEDAFRWELRANRANYLAEEYRRPIVYNVYHDDGQELFDHHVYEKGALVLHMLRYVLGEPAFWRAIQHYARTNRGREVISTDLERAIEESTGKSMGRFFEQWIYKAGHPEFKASFDWNADTNLARIRIEQKQKVNEQTPLFHTPVDIAFVVPGPDGQEPTTSTFRIDITEADQICYFPLAARPLMVRFDPGGWILKTLDFERPAEMLRYQLVHDPDILGRIEAAEALARLADPESVAALAAALPTDPFWGVQMEIARALGQIRSPAALDALLHGLVQVHEPHARRGIVDALGEFHYPEQPELADRAAAALSQLLDAGEPSYFVEMAAAIALGKTRAPGAFERLARHSDVPSWNELIRRGVFQGLARTRDLRAVAILTSWLTDRTRPMLARQGAAAALGAIAEYLPAGSAERRDALDALIAGLEDPWIMTRLAVTHALRAYGDPRAIPALEALIERELEGRVVRSARVTLQRLREGRDRDEALRRLRSDLDELREQNRKLRDRLAALEARTGAASPQSIATGQ
jgi:aminopeptidase N